MLGWTQVDLARRSKVAKPTIADFETGRRQPYERTLADIQRALESAGVKFVENGAVLTANCEATIETAAPGERNRLFQDDPSDQSNLTDSPPNPTRGRSRALAPDDEHR